MTSRNDEDADLVQHYLSGDVAAFDELMRVHENRVFRVCLRMLRDRDAALDATQETFLTIFRKADRYRGEAAFSTWLYRISVNVCYDYLRRQKRRQADALPESHDPADAQAEDAFSAVELRPDIDNALQELQAEFRGAVVLVDLEGLSLEMASKILDVPIGTVKSRVFRGRRFLAKHLGNLHHRPEHPRGD